MIVHQYMSLCESFHDSLEFHQRESNLSLILIDLRDPSTTPLNFTKSINLALSERGVNGLRSSGSQDLDQRIIQETIPMHGRMIHGRDLTGQLYSQSQEYDVGGRVCYPPLYKWICF